MGMLPIMCATGTGEELMKRSVAPMVGGAATSFLLELLIYPCIFTGWKWNFEVKRQKALEPVSYPMNEPLNRERTDVGTVMSIRGSVVDARFPNGFPPLTTSSAAGPRAASSSKW